MGPGKLLQRAMAHRWLDRGDFEAPGAHTKSGKMCLLDFLPMFRNGLAHGSTNLFPQGSLEMLRLCSDILNRLYSTRSPKRDLWVVLCIARYAQLPQIWSRSTASLRPFAANHCFARSVSRQWLCTVSQNFAE